MNLKESLQFYIKNNKGNFSKDEDTKFYKNYTILNYNI